MGPAVRQHHRQPRHGQAIDRMSAPPCPHCLPQASDRQGAAQEALVGALSGAHDEEQAGRAAPASREGMSTGALGTAHEQQRGTESLERATASQPEGRWPRLAQRDSSEQAVRSSSQKPQRKSQSVCNLGFARQRVSLRTVLWKSSPMSMKAPRNEPSF